MTFYDIKQSTEYFEAQFTKDISQSDMNYDILLIILPQKPTTLSVNSIWAFMPCNPFSQIGSAFIIDILEKSIL